MEALNWKKFIEEDEYEIQKIPRQALNWSDIVTGTKCFLKINDYNTMICDLHNKTKDCDYEELISFLKTDKKIKLLPWKDGESVKKTFFIDVIKLYVLFACIFDNANKNHREEIYKDFILGKYSFDTAYKIVKVITDKKTISKEDEKLLKELHITLVKGGVFKVKKYFMENNKLKDMRGASALLTYVTEKKIPEIIDENFMNEGLIYSGGGNVMCIVPDKNQAVNLCRKFEKSFDKYTLTVENAFSYHKCSLYDFIKNYKDTMGRLESKIENRKKLKIYNNVVSKSLLKDSEEGIELYDKPIPIFADEVDNDKEICVLCSGRKALYSLKKEAINVCGSCLHKHIIGSQEKCNYNNKIKKYIQEKYGIKKDENYNFKTIGSIDEIDNANNNIAVIYGDGNNIGAIIQNVESICEMMYFSRKIQNAANESVYEAIFRNIDDEKNPFKFEIIALGGDDIFFIVPASKALNIAKDLIDVFNNQFSNRTEKNKNKYNATMSIGIVISDSKNDIRKLVEISQEELKIAKDEERKLLLENKNSGSLSIAFIKGSNYLSKKLMKNPNNNINQTMLPMSNDTFKDMLQIISKLKESKIRLSSISRLEQASREMDISEFMLFYLYNQAKNNKVSSKIFTENNVEVYEFDKGTFNKNIKSDKDKKVYFPWSDILNFWDFVESKGELH